jgi:hypothetical protein
VNLAITAAEGRGTVGVSLSGTQYSIVADSCSERELTEGDICNVEVALATAQVGAASAELLLNAPAGSVSATLEGRRVSTGGLVFQPSSVDSGSPLLFQSVDRTVRVTFEGTGKTGPLQLATTGPVGVVTTDCGSPWPGARAAPFSFGSRPRPRGRLPEH